MKRWAWVAWVLGLSACKAEPVRSKVEFRAPVKLQAKLEPMARKAWERSLAQHRKQVRSGEEPVFLSFWVDQEGSHAVLYLGVAWPPGFVHEPRSASMVSPIKLGVALDSTEAPVEEYELGIQALVELFWVQVQLAQSDWPISSSLLLEPSSMPVRFMTAAWLGQYGRPDATLASGCLSLLAHALAKPSEPQIERLESSVACLAKVAQPEQVPRILDLMPNGHLRVEMLRVELLGALGGGLARSEVRWVKEQAEEPALVRAATLALESLEAGSIGAAFP